MDKKDLPLSFVMALAQNESAMNQFKALNNQQKQAVINKASKINSKQDMQSFVNYFSEGSLGI